MKSTFTYFVLLIAAFCSCTTNQSAKTEADSIQTDVPHDTVKAAEQQTAIAHSVNYAAPVADLKDTDTLFNFLARRELVQGQFSFVSVVTSNFIDVSHLAKERPLLGVLVVSGEGAYAGGRQDVQFATQYAVFAVLEWNENSELQLVDHLDLGKTESQGLYAFEVDGTEMTLAEGRNGVLIHSKSSEEGAGDGGFRRDDVVLYVLMNDKITPVLETNLEDYGFSSDEQGSWEERTSTTEITPLEEATNGLVDLLIRTTTVTNGSTPEEETEQPEEPAEEGTEEPVEENPVFKWTGKSYERYIAANE
jgi:hypothetical protein